MKTKEFLKQHSACCDGARWALSISKEMSDVWDAMLSQEKHEWLIWTATLPGVFPDSVLRKLACRFVRETPLSDGRTVWDMMTDERSRIAIEVAELYADGKATYEKLRAAHAAAYDAACDAYDAAAYDSVHAARAATYAASHAARAATYVADAADSAADAAYHAVDSAADTALRAAYADAKAAQIKMIAELGNPFKE